MGSSAGARAGALRGSRGRVAAGALEEEQGLKGLPLLKRRVTCRQRGVGTRERGTRGALENLAVLK